MNISRQGFTFDDVLLQPNFSDIVSRKDISLLCKITKKRYLSIPIVSANMDTITELSMAAEMSILGGIGIIHRFMSIGDMARNCKWLSAYTKTIAVSIGINNEDVWPRVWAALENGANILCVDVAHGHHKRVVNLIKKLKDDPRIVDNNIEIIAGNVSTYEGASSLIAAGADAIKVGIGPGSLCTTRIRTGHGVPQLTAISDCYSATLGTGIPIIADGGICSSGDIVKAMAAGADTVMIGGLFAGTNETPGDVVDGFKVYRGMASREAQMDWKGSVSVVEGEAKRVAVRGPVAPIINDLVDGIRSGFSYSGASDLYELRNKATFIQVTHATQVENLPHGLTPTKS